ncbi:hypothetical protein FHW69_000532 [Luteibacter sp. Sphag1AF]|uniref:hypothetical protein n=1 Tax=Luteibacter sp. Sphag1AF TaxID=2587031 RepID=UPI0016102636|nr:hypothetical protein [Luteibacter sp. Sphag1AF]MBB3225942.1 hypothetical protein [Luteibacter sp. Sphag1AF]
MTTLFLLRRAAPFFLCLWAAAAVAQQAAASDTDAVVKAVMKDQYGDYVAKHHCWAFTYEGEDGRSVDYCMRAGKPQIVETPVGKVLYLMAASATDAGDDERFRYAHAQSGLMGAFRIKLGGPQGWTYTARESGMAFGSSGDCGCSKAELVKVSANGNYGWLFTHGGVWQGTVVSLYALVAPVGNQFTNVSTIPQIAEDEQDAEYALSIQSDANVTGMYPLKVVKTREGAKSQTFTVLFNTKTKTYVLPRAH